MEIETQVRYLFSDTDRGSRKSQCHIPASFSFDTVSKLRSPKEDKMLNLLKGKFFVARIDREMERQKRSPFRSCYQPKQIMTVNGIDLVVSIDARGVKTLHTAFDSNDRIEYLLPTEDKVIDVTWREI